MQPPIDWGTFQDKDSLAHVVPVVEGKMMDGHTLAIDCKCWPDVKRYPQKVIVIHKVIH